MSSKPNVRLEAAIFFAAACLVVVLAANYQTILADIAGLIGVEGAKATGAGWRVVVVGFVVAAVAYGGAVIVLIPIYGFLLDLLQRIGSSKKEEADTARPQQPAAKTKKRRRSR